MTDGKSIGEVANLEQDEVLYFRYLGGEDDALRKLLERHRESLTLFLYGIVGSMEDAEDLMMDAFAALLAKDKIFAGKSSFKTWLFAIGRHKAVSLLRKKHLGLAAVTEPMVPPDLSILRKERHGQLYQAMYGLKTEYRQALYLAYFEGMTPAETAHVMGKTARQITFLIYRGKQALKTALEKEGFEYAEY